MKNLFILLTSILFITTGSISAQSKKQLKKQQKQAEYNVTKKLIEGGKFVFKADWATSYKGRRVNISGDGSSLIFDNNSTIANLPFFGQSQNASYSGNGGIKFSNISTKLDIKYDDKKAKIIIKFKSENKSEYYIVFLTIQSNGNSSLNIASSVRSYMSYDGEIEEISETEK